MISTLRRSFFWTSGALLAFSLATSAAASSSIKIVAIGASNTSGWGVSADEAYPARLERLLQAKGYNAHIVNAGVIFDTTSGMLARLESAVPEGTRLVILQPGGNDLRFFGNRERRSANIDAMVKRLRERRIKSVVFDPVIPPRYYQGDGIHLSAEGHAMFAAKLLPLVMNTIAGDR
jgi:acyl-CoA thioesterase I